MVPDGSTSEFSPKEFARAEWRGRTIWLRIYRTLRVPIENVLTPVVIDIGEVRAVAAHGTLSFMEMPTPRVDVESGRLNVNLGRIERRTLEEDTYLLLLTPLEVRRSNVGETPNEPTALARLSQAVGLLAALFGTSLAYERVHETSIDLATGSVSLYTQSIANPFSRDAPSLSRASRKLATLAAARIYGLTDVARNRLDLSLRWYESALLDTEVDAFLKYWIALETLLMPSTHIRPIIGSLSRAYCISPESARERFQVGRLFGIRTKIVHDGHRVRLDDGLLHYVSALYEDCLFEFLGLPPQHRAERVSERSGAKAFALLLKTSS